MLRKIALIIGFILVCLLNQVSAATYTVINTNNAGAGSLRQAIIDANNNAGEDNIEFNIPDTDANYHTGGGMSWWEIDPTTELPALTDDGTFINGNSQSVNQGEANPTGPEIVLDGDSAAGINGITINAADCRIWDLIIKRFDTGVVISGEGATANLIVGNYIGTEGSDPFPNTETGIKIVAGAHSNRIGGTAAELRNIISGNTDAVGIRITTNSNEVHGNYIGTDRNGTAALANEIGIVLSNGAAYNFIGSATPEGGNIISGNTGDGLSIDGASHNNVISGNYIGTDVNGTSALANGDDGIYIHGGSQFNYIGTKGGEEGRNIISGNTGNGVLIGEADTKFNELTNNYVGVDASGVVALGNGETGILLANGTQANSIGSRDEGARNIISGNAQAGIGISGANTSHHTVEGNYIGTNASGTAALPNGQGVALGGGAQYNSIGSPGEARNIISGNTEQGVAIHGSTTCSNEIIANYIGTAANGVDDLGNGAHGVLIEEDAPRWNIVGVNVIAYNSTPGSQDGGVAVSQGAKYNAISQNSIFSNSGNGINLGPPGNRGNEDKAYPSITYAYINSGTVYVVGTAEPLNDVEIFHGYDCQGRTYEARTFTDPQGDWSWSSGSSGFSSGDLITTTATNIEANTSEFTPCVAVSASVPATTTTTTTSTTVAEGTTSTTAAGGTTSTTAAEGTTTTTTLAPVTEVVETSPTWNENQKAIEISYRTSQTGQLEFLVLNSQGTLVGRTAPQTISMSAAASWQSIAVNLDPKPSRGVYLLIAKINGTPVGKSHIIIK